MPCPCACGGVIIGALNLFRAEEGALKKADIVAAQASADVATIAILQHRAAIQTHIVNEQLNYALNNRIMIEQAKGVLADRAGLDMEGAFSWLRNHADHNLLLVDVAQSVMAGPWRPIPPRLSHRP